MTSYAISWLDLVVRWFHFTAGVAWIGTSMYFVWLDDHLTAPAKSEDIGHGVTGELWSVHGGGFYHNQKYLTGPKNEPLTPDLHWFKWEAYSTWLSGMVMLAIVYWIGAGTYLIDRSVLNLTPLQAIGASIGVIAVGNLAYEILCGAFAKNPLALGVAIYVFLVAAAWGLTHVFSARAAYMHIGAIVGTIMVANVAHVIIPGQRKMLDDIRAGREPDPRPGLRGKTRSVHNTYFTLPVLFIMISGHYPMTYQSPYGWIALAVLGLAGVLVRYFFILTHKGRYVVALPVAAAALIAAIAVALAPHSSSQVSATPVAFAQVAPIVHQRCTVCHSGPAAPNGVLLDTPAHIAANAPRIEEQAVATHAMPLGNATGMTDAERAALGAWIASGAKI
ncbi:MAG: urate hydroxylase PuuD [Candidatus Eremiobacteraeota bacterium]|nr:urate hydroxylase PuuD [Candidatus Eremiobacteraeota bacterium]